MDLVMIFKGCDTVEDCPMFLKNLFNFQNVAHGIKDMKIIYLNLSLECGLNKVASKCGATY